MMKTFLTFLLMFLAIPAGFAAEVPAARYFHSGDGRINIASAKSGAAFKGVYRNPDGRYNEAALKAISRVFGAKYGDPLSEISPRFIEFLSWLDSQMNPGARITIASGFRSPEHNMKLREKGKLAAKTSLHQYGMAADLRIEGVPSERVWNFIKDLGYGGAGFYHGGLVHLDVGPARFWDETTSGVWTDIADDNKLIALVADKDIYLPGETATLRFIRMSAFPIGVSPQFILERKSGDGGWKRVEAIGASFSSGADGACPTFERIVDMLGIRFVLSSDLKPGRYRIRATFCDRQWEKMPESVATAEFEVVAP